MTSDLEIELESARQAIIAGRIEDAAAHCDRAFLHAQQTHPEAEAKARIKSAVITLQILADASLRGTKKAAAQVEEIVRAASNLQVYEPNGQRRETSIVANMPRRF